MEEDFTKSDPDDNSVLKNLNDDNLEKKQNKNEKLKLTRKHVDEDFKNLGNFDIFFTVFFREKSF